MENPQYANKNFFDLRLWFGHDSAIPNDVLYEYLNRATTRDAQEKFIEIDDIEKLDKLTEQEIDPALKELWASRQEARRRARSDLFFFSKYFLHETHPEMAGRPIEDCMINERTHRPLCDAFVKKDITKTIADQEGEDRKKERKYRTILYPRGSFKSTIDVADTAQWVINFPEIRILFLTAADDLAVGFVDQTKAHFVQRLYDKSLMNLFFPEFCLPESQMGSEFEFVSPVWSRKEVKRNEPTVMAASVTSSLSGFHFEVIKADDAVSDRNSENDVQCKSVTQKVILRSKMLRPFGYLDRLGTRYAEDDMYGDVLAKNVGTHVFRILDTRTAPLYNPCWEAYENPDTGMKILIGRAWQLTPDAREKIEKGLLDPENVTAEHYDLLFPDVLSFKFLRSEQADNDYTFEGQYNQNPRPSTKVDIPRALLIKNTVQSTELPFRGPVSQTWDFAFSKKKGRDYSTGANVFWNDKGQMFVNDLIRAHFKPSELAKAVVDFARKWKPYVIGIEDAAGSRLLEPTIQAMAKETGIDWLIGLCNRIDWITPERNEDAKRMRMGALQPWLINGNLKFANYTPFLTVLYDEFEACMRDGYQHNDIPDVISRQVKYAPQMSQLIDKKEVSSWSMQDAWSNLIFEDNCDPFGRVGFGTPVSQPMVQTEPDWVPPAEAPEGLPTILGSGLYG